MNAFVVLFEPALPRVAPDSSEIAPDSIDRRRVRDHAPQWYNLIFNVAGVRVCYYPSCMMTIFDDLCETLAIVRSRTSHPISISGYPVLDAEFEGRALKLYHADELSLPTRSPINGSFDVDDIDAALSAGLRQLWSVVKAAEAGPL